MDDHMEEDELLDRSEYIAFLNANLDGVHLPTQQEPEEPIVIQETQREDEWQHVSWESKKLPEFIKSLGHYPVSSIFATCFQEELDQLFMDWFDENGNILDDKDARELNIALEKLDLLENSLDFLNRVVPVGR